MNQESICQSLRKAGHDAALIDGGSRLKVTFQLGGRPIKLVHDFQEILLRVPRFDLERGHGFGKLAHVLSDGDGHGARSVSAMSRQRPSTSIAPSASTWTPSRSTFNC